jgi:preprotein translocase subunit SecY
MWLGEVMSDHGIGNGISLLIFAGIVARIPEAIIRTFTLVRLGEMNILILVLAVVLMIAVVAGCVMLQEGSAVPVQYAKRMVGNKMYGGQSTFIPLRVNTAGVIPIIFASSVLLFPYTIAVCSRIVCTGSPACVQPKQPDLHDTLRGDDNLLLVLLHSGSLQA